MSTIRVRAKDGLTVLHPETGAQITERELIKTPAIIRMLNDGDLEEIDSPVPAKATKQEEGE